jgi:MFS superfamily sulfate permease-like transporter
MAGVILLAMGIARLGGVIKFIPNPVIVGFTSGIAVIIWVGQWKDFFGVQPAASGLHFHEVFGEPDPATALDDTQQTVLPRNALVYRIEGPFFFGAAEKLERTLERVQLDICTIILRLDRVPFADATGMQTLSEIIERFQRRRVRVMLCGIRPALFDSLQRAEVLALVGPENICANLTEAARALAKAPARE